MRVHGTLVKWNAERGFGFLAPAQGEEQVFVHVSAFPRDGVAPLVGELLSFEIVLADDGRKRATRVMRTRSARATSAPIPSARPAQPRHMRRAAGSSSPILATVAMLGLGLFAYQRFHVPRPVIPPAVAQPERAATPDSLLERRYVCDGRTTCPQMHSCEEARYFVKNCPGTKMDGDEDGEPCEDQWCS